MLAQPPCWPCFSFKVSICDLKRFAFAYLYLKCGATSPLGKRIPALIKKARAASLLAVEAFLAASNLSCLLLSNKSIFYLLVLKVEHFFCKDYANERNVSLLTDCRAPLIFCKDYASECNESLLSDCRAPLIFCKDTLFFWKMQRIIEKCLRMREIKRKTKKTGHHQHRIIWERALPGQRCKDNN